jgi:DNA-binding FadR family transcriptional regulator
MDGLGSTPSRRLELLPLLVPRACGPVSGRVQIAIERSIALGLFPEGRLPAERHLASALDVSRTALRAALDLVRASGYAEQSLVGRTGGVPTASGIPLSPEQVAADANQALIEIDRLAATRDFLESACARRAAADRPRELVRQLIESQERLVDAPTQVAHRLTDGEFHYTLSMASGTDEVVGAVLRARADLLRWRDRLPMEDTVGHSVTEHHSIIAAIEAGCPDEAEAAMRDHLDSSRQLFMLFLRRYVDEPISVLAEGRAAVDRSLDPATAPKPLAPHGPWRVPSPPY